MTNCAWVRWQLYILQPGSRQTTASVSTDLHVVPLHVLSALSFLPPSLDISAQEGQEVKKNFREPLKRQTTMKPAQPAITSVQFFSPDEARRCLSHPSRRQPAALALLLSRARGELMQQRDLCPVTHSSWCMQLCDPAAPSVLCRS